MQAHVNFTARLVRPAHHPMLVLAKRKPCGSLESNTEGT